MSEAKHTPGRIRVWRATDGSVNLVTHAKEYVALVGRGPEGRERIEADADRLVGAWNACDGVPTSALTPGAVRALVEAARETVAWARRVGGHDAYPMTDTDLDALAEALAPFEREG